MKRDIKELLQAVLEEGNKNYSYGICSLVCNMCAYGEINEEERKDLMEYIKSHRPKPDSPHYCESQRISAFFWPIGEWKPRKKWLEDQIKSL